jgi:hypothetical protein
MVLVGLPTNNFLLVYKVFIIKNKEKRGYIHKCATEVSLKAYCSA